jgi:hypothetical protein
VFADWRVELPVFGNLREARCEEFILGKSSRLRKVLSHVFLGDDID